MKAYIIKIELQDVKPPVWRRIMIPAEIPFWRLHQTIQFAMGWKNHHYHQFNFPKQGLRVTDDEEDVDRYQFYCENHKKLANRPDPEGHIQRILELEVRLSEKTRLGEILERPGDMEYIYDFGDYWVHKLTLEEIRYDYPVGYPQIISGEGDCPPEDVGGPSGYQKFLKAWNNPKSKRYEETRSWAEAQWWRPFDLSHRNDLMKEILKLKKVK